MSWEKSTRGKLWFYNSRIQFLMSSRSRCGLIFSTDATASRDCQVLNGWYERRKDRVNESQKRLNVKSRDDIREFKRVKMLLGPDARSQLWSGPRTTSRPQACPSCLSKAASGGSATRSNGKVATDGAMTRALDCEESWQTRVTTELPLAILRFQEI